MQLEIKTPNGEKTMLLGYEAVKALAKSQQAEEDEITMIESVALSGFNTFERRNGQELTPRDLMIQWFDDFDIFFLVKGAVEEFSINFSAKVSQLEKAKKKAK